MCKLSGVPFRQAMAFFPLGDTLIDHLKKIDPERDQTKDRVAELRDNNEALLRSQQRAIFNNMEAYTKDNFVKLAGLAQVGRTGKESAWLDAPERGISNERQKLGIDHGSQIIGV
jgi:hypothetical protein